MTTPLDLTLELTEVVRQRDAQIDRLIARLDEMYEQVQQLQHYIDELEKQTQEDPNHAD